MVTNSSPANAEQKRASSLEQVVIDFLEIIFVCNPLSMFLFNLFAPRLAVEYVASKKSNHLTFCYAVLASLMPFYWNKYWMSLVGVQHYSKRLQKKYYLRYDSTSETLRAMDSDLVEEIFRENIDNCDVMEYISANHRPSDKMLLEFFQNGQIQYLRMFAKYGPFTKSQILQLIDVAKSEVMTGYSSAGLVDWRQLDFLVEYFKKFDTDSEITASLHNLNGLDDAIVKHWKHAIDIAMEAHSQKVLTNNLRKNYDEKQWQNFCENTQNISYEAEICMCSDQYKVFHRTGHKLSAEAIKFMMQKADHMICCQIFHYEPNFGLITDEIASIVKSSRDLYPMYLSISTK